MENPEFRYATEKVLDIVIEQGEVILADKNGKDIVKPIIARQKVINDIQIVRQKLNNPEEKWNGRDI